jgi:hypothetical protein
LGNEPPNKDKESATLEQGQLRVLANFFRQCSGKESFGAMLERAASMAGIGGLSFANVWRKIADEIDRMDAADTADTADTAVAAKHRHIGE